MNEQKSPADRVADDIQEAVDAIINTSGITLLRSKMKREQRREFLIQEAEFEAKLLEDDGDGDLAGQLRRIAEGLRVLQPKVEATGQGDLQT